MIKKINKENVFKNVRLMFKMIPLLMYICIYYSILPLQCEQILVVPGKWVRAWSDQFHEIDQL